MPPRTVLTALLALLAVTAGCSGSEAPRSPARQAATPGPTPIQQRQELPAAYIDSSPLWRQPRRWHIPTPILHGGALVAWQFGLDEPERLFVADAATGRVRWSRPGGRPISGGIELTGQTPEVIDVGEDWYVVTKYERSVCRAAECHPEQGVVALSGRDGTVRWKTRLAAGYPHRAGPDRHPFLTVRDASDRIVLATLTPHSGAGGRTVGLDPATGRIRWQARDLWPRQVAGGTIIGDDRTDPGPPDSVLPLTPSGRVAAFDAGTGHRLWNLARYSGSAIETVSGNAVLVRTVAGSSRVTQRVLDLRTGSELATLPAVDRLQMRPCTGDGSALIVCMRPSDSGEFRLVVYHVSQRRLTVSARGVSDEFAQPVQAWKGRIFFGDRNTCFAVDAAGNRIGSALPGIPELIGDRYAIVQPFDSYRFVVHRVTA